MTLLPLELGVRRMPHAQDGAGNSKRPRALKAKDWPRLRDRVLARDKHTCRYCGFKAEKFQRVHFTQGLMADPTVDNLSTACIFCEQCFELESVANMDSGLLIWLPDLSQADLHHLCRALYVAKVKEEEPLSGRAQTVLDQLLARRTEAKRRLGTDDPIMLATALAEQVSDHDYKDRAERLDGIRLLPLPRRISFNDDGQYDQFPRILAYWASKSGPFGKYPTEKWQSLIAA